MPGRDVRRAAVARIAGRERITPEEASLCFGLVGRPMETFGLVVGGDGLVDSREMMAALDERVRATRSRRFTTTRPAPIEVSLRRYPKSPDSLDTAFCTTWDMHVTGLSEAIGVLAATSVSAEPVVCPSPAIGCWLADPSPRYSSPDAQTMGAISARAAQWLLLSQAQIPRMIQPPRWAEHVRPLSWEEALQAQHLADAVLLGQDLPDTPLLNEWERHEILAGPARNPVNLAMAMARSYEPEDWWRLLRPIPEPTPLVAQPMSAATTRWNTAAVAGFLGVEPATVRSWRSRNQLDFPPPDSEPGEPAWWHRTTIEQWNAQRPGRGNHNPRP